MRVGSMEVMETDIRLVAASNRDPHQAMMSGKLREDLFYRLNVFPIKLPALRECADDIGLIAGHFLEEISRREGQYKRFSPEALTRLAAYRWPGNVRELRNVIEQAVLLAPGEVILPQELMLPGVQAASRDEPAALSRDGESALDRVERELLVQALTEANDNVSQAARKLGISRDTLRYRLEKLPLRGAGDGA